MHIGACGIDKHFGDKCCEAKLRSTSKAGGLPSEEYEGAPRIHTHKGVMGND